MVKNLTNFFIAIGFLLLQFLNFAIGLPQLLQPQPYTTITGFIRFFIGKLGLESISKMPQL